MRFICWAIVICVCIFQAFAETCELEMAKQFTLNVQNIFSSKIWGSPKIYHHQGETLQTWTTLFPNSREKFISRSIPEKAEVKTSGILTLMMDSQSYFSLFWEVFTTRYAWNKYKLYHSTEVPNGAELYEDIKSSFSPSSRPEDFLVMNVGAYQIEFFGGNGDNAIGNLVIKERHWNLNVGNIYFLRPRNGLALEFYQKFQARVFIPSSKYQKWKIGNFENGHITLKSASTLSSSEWYLYYDAPPVGSPSFSMVQFSSGTPIENQLHGTTWFEVIEESVKGDGFRLRPSNSLSYLCFESSSDFTEVTLCDGWNLNQLLKFANQDTLEDTTWPHISDFY